MDRLLIYCIVFLGAFTVACSIASLLELPNGTFHTPTNLSSSPKNVLNSSGYIEWKNIPVRVSAYGGVKKYLKNDAIESVKEWNKLIGCKVMVYEEVDYPEITIKTSTLDSEHPDWLASARFVKNKKSNFEYWSSEIRVYVLFLNNPIVRKHIMMHELGHSLGLDDTYDAKEKEKGNVMHGRSLTGFFVDPNSLHILREMYCK